MKGNNDTFESRKIRILIISDRLPDEARVLAGYLRCTGNFDVIGIAGNRQQALSIAQDQSFDFLIIAGYLKMEYTYTAIAELRRERKEFLPVQWAMLDPLIAMFCQRYRIPLQFERTRPMADFARYLESHRNDPVPDIPPPLPTSPSKSFQSSLWRRRSTYRNFP